MSDKLNKEIERRRYASVRAARVLGLTKVTAWDDLPEPIKKTMEAMDYNSIVAVLLPGEFEAGNSLQMIANKFGLSKTTVYNLKNRSK